MKWKANWWKNWSKQPLRKWLVALGGKGSKKKKIFTIVFNEKKKYFWKFKFIIFQADMIFNLMKIVNFGIYILLFAHNLATS